MRLSRMARVSATRGGISAHRCRSRSKIAGSGGARFQQTRKKRLLRDRVSRWTVDAAPFVLGSRQYRREVEFLAQTIGPDNGRGGCLDTDVTGDTPTAAIARVKRRRCRRVMARQVNVGSVRRCLLDVCDPLGSACLESGHRRYCDRKLLPGRVRSSWCVIVARVGIRDVRGTDQEEQGSQHSNRKHGEPGPDSHLPCPAQRIA
jgi:hypothetical protein